MLISAGLIRDPNFSWFDLVLVMAFFGQEMLISAGLIRDSNFFVILSSTRHGIFLDKKCSFPQVL